MNFTERLAATLILRDRYAVLYGNAFEDFITDMLSARFPSFVPVRTAGRLGDMSADGLLLRDGKLYACYAPQVYDAGHVASKFESDLANAIEKRSGQFTEFVFVHNDLRGVHPQASALLAQAQQEHPELSFSQFGFVRARILLTSLSRDTAEDLLSCPLPVQDLVYGVGAYELADLINHLDRKKLNATDVVTPSEVSGQKMRFNGIRDGARALLLDGIRNSPEVRRYYDGIRDVVARDEAAEAFGAEYQTIAASYSDPEDVLWQLEVYVLGNASSNPKTRRASQAIIAYFFEECDIFEEPPEDWATTEMAAS